MMCMGSMSNESDSDTKAYLEGYQSGYMDAVERARRDERKRIADWLDAGAGEREQHWNEVYARKLREMKD